MWERSTKALLEQSDRGSKRPEAGLGIRMGVGAGKKSRQFTAEPAQRPLSQQRQTQDQEHSLAITALRVPSSNCCALRVTLTAKHRQAIYES